MEDLMNKVARDLQNYSPEAPAGMEERIQKALSKRKSFWSFSWYTLNVYLVGLATAGIVSAVVLSGEPSAELSAVNSPQKSSEISINVVVAAPVNAEQAPAKLKKGRVKEAVSQLPPIAKVSEVLPTDVHSEATPVSEIIVAEKESVVEDMQVPKAVPSLVQTRKGRALKLTRLFSN